MSCGVPVVAYRAGGLPEVVTHGENGLLVPVGEVEEGAAAAACLLGNPELWRRFSEGGRQEAVERFAVARVLPRYEALYRTLV